MAVILQGKNRYITDRTILQMSDKKKDIPRKDLQDFCAMLGRVGVDFIEVDRKTFEALGALPEGGRYIFRIEKEEDMRMCFEHGFKYCVMGSRSLMWAQMQYKRKLEKIKTILEVDVYNAQKTEHLIRLKGFIDFQGIYGIRMKGLSQSMLIDWYDIIGMIKEYLSVKVDLCPEDKYHMATAAGVEGLMNGADFVTATFGGSGGLYGFAALEEVLLAAKVIGGLRVRGDMTLLPELRRLYEKMTGENVKGIKPVVGDDIFKYESGIHADGIRKNPATYEPYGPDEVGQRRQLILGKHSGSNAVIMKLKELCIDCEGKNVTDILKRMRAKSIRLKRSVPDSEFIALCNEL